jgi:hypothetical protein
MKYQKGDKVELNACWTDFNGEPYFPGIQFEIGTYDLISDRYYLLNGNPTFSTHASEYELDHYFMVLPKISGGYGATGYKFQVGDEVWCTKYKQVFKIKTQASITPLDTFYEAQEVAYPHSIFVKAESELDYIANHVPQQAGPLIPKFKVGDRVTKTGFGLSKILFGGTISYYNSVANTYNVLWDGDASPICGYSENELQLDSSHHTSGQAISVMNNFTHGMKNLTTSYTDAWFKTGQETVAAILGDKKKSCECGSAKTYGNSCTSDMHSSWCPAGKA